VSLNKKSFVAFILCLFFGADGFAYCSYQDCGQNVLVHKNYLSLKISSTLSETYNAIEEVDKSYNEHTKAVIEQNGIIEKFERLSKKNNITLKEIAMEQKKLSELISQQNKLQAKKSEALLFQSDQLSLISKLQMEKK